MSESTAPNVAAKTADAARAGRRSRRVVVFWTLIAALQIPLLFSCGFRAVFGTITSLFGVEITERTVNSSPSCPRWRAPSLGDQCPERGARCEYRSWTTVRSHPPVFICRDRRWDRARDSDVELLSL